MKKNLGLAILCACLLLAFSESSHASRNRHKPRRVPFSEPSRASKNWHKHRGQFLVRENKPNGNTIQTALQEYISDYDWEKSWEDRVFRHHMVLEVYRRLALNEMSWSLVKTIETLSKIMSNQGTYHEPFNPFVSLNASAEQFACWLSSDFLKDGHPYTCIEIPNSKFISLRDYIKNTLLPYYRPNDETIIRNFYKILDHVQWIIPGDGH